MEVIFAIVIIGILASIALPRLAASRDDAKALVMFKNIDDTISEVLTYLAINKDFEFSIENELSYTEAGFIGSGKPGATGMGRMVVRYGGDILNPQYKQTVTEKINSKGTKVITYNQGGSEGHVGPYLIDKDGKTVFFSCAQLEFFRPIEMPGMTDIPYAIRLHYNPDFNHAGPKIRPYIGACHALHKLLAKKYPSNTGVEGVYELDINL